MSKFYFRCKTNPTAAPLVLESFWEAKEMKNHPDYERIDEFGEVIVDEQDTAENPIPFHPAGQKRAA
jgi:hypothetical protein